MADYIYLLENRLSKAQRQALRAVGEVARQKGQTLFLVGGAVRDLTSGSPVRDLDVVVQGNAAKLKKELVAAGGVVMGEYEPGQTLHLLFPGSVRMEVSSTLSVAYPKPGKPVYKPANILDDLRRRDFTANAMALSLNQGSYGLLMDPLNGVADIENRQLRLVSNYGFIEDPVRMIRAARLIARLGWTMEEKTQTRYDTGKEEGYIAALSEYLRGSETEEIVHEEDPLRVLRGLEAEGWMKVLAPFWTIAKANIPELERLRNLQTQLQMQGMTPDTASAQFPLLTAKLAPKEIVSLKESFPRPGFVAEIESLDGEAREFAVQLNGKGAAQPSQAWKLLTAARPEVVLWTAFTSKSAPLQAKFQAFLKDWPQARLKMPYATLQEMRILPDLPGYEALLESLFFELMDGRLSTAEEMKAFLEPHSPPAPPPPVNLRRPRVAKKEAKPAKSRSKKAASVTNDTQDEAAEEEAAATVPTAPPALASQVPVPVVVPPPAAAKDNILKKVAPSSKASPAKPAEPASQAGLQAAVKASAPVKPQIPATPIKGVAAVAAKSSKPAAKKTASSPSKPLAKSPVTLSAKSAAKTAAKAPPPVKTVVKQSLAKKGAGKASVPAAVKPAAKSKAVAAKKVDVPDKAATKKSSVKAVALPTARRRS